MRMAALFNKCTIAAAERISKIFIVPVSVCGLNIYNISYKRTTGNLFHDLSFAYFKYASGNKRNDINNLLQILYKINVIEFII